MFVSSVQHISKCICYSGLTCIIGIGFMSPARATGYTFPIISGYRRRRFHIYSCLMASFNFSL